MRTNPGLTRRRFLSATVAMATAFELRRAAFALGFSTDSTVCTLTPEQEVGPYYVADELLRSDIAENKPGVPLTLRIALLDARTCTPLTGAAVDLWHCDALGIYSGYTKQPQGMGSGESPQGGPPPGGGPPPDFSQGPPQGGPPPNFQGGEPPAPHPTDKLTFLRGIQLTGNDGSVSFDTIFPGFYPGRTNHIHFKVRLGGQTNNAMYTAGHTSHTGQVFFPEDVAVTLMQHGPYAKHRIHRTTQAEDMVFNGQHGAQSMATLKPRKSGNWTAGLHAELIAAVDPTATPAPADRMGAFVGPPIAS
jgi:protocatechuate 3,4-dioxygenase beta subunit